MLRNDLNRNRLTYFIQNLKDFIGAVKLPPEVFKELKAIISHFAFILTIFKKYEDTLISCGIEGPIADKVKAVGWLLYILARIVILKSRNEIIESACLLIAVVTTLVVNKPDSISFNKLKVSAKPTSSEVKKALCDMFKLRNHDVVDSLMEPFLKLLTQLVSTDAMKTDGSGDTKENEVVESYGKIFSAEQIENVIRKLNALYQQSVSLEGIDERSFIASETRITTPVKLTPFARQGVANIILTPKRPRKESEADLAGRGDVRPQRKNSTYVILPNILLIIFKHYRQLTMNTKLNEIKFSQYAPTSPYPTLKIQATPITRAMEMNNWLNEQVSRVKILDNGLSSEYSRLMTSQASRVLPRIKSLLDSCMEKISPALGCPKEGKLGIKSMQVKFMYFRIVEELVLVEEKASKSSDLSGILQSEDFHKGALVAAAETTLFVHNTITLMFEEILDLVNISAFDFWKLLPSFMKFDMSMPSPIVHHFGEIESKILEILAWESRSPINSLIFKIIGDESKGTEMVTGTSSHLKYAHERFFKKILQLAASHVEEITTALGLSNEGIREKIWEAMKLCLSTETDLLIDRHLDQIILCGIYAVCKMEESKKSSQCESYSFNKIITCYLQLNGKKGKNTSGLFQAVKLSDGKAGDIIAFYNAIYVPRMKSALCKLCLGTEGGADALASKIKIKALAPLSPLKEVSERSKGLTMQQRMAGAQLTPSKSPILSTRQYGSTPIMTPRTQRLFAYSESPAVKGRPAVFTPTFASQAGTLGYKDKLITLLKQQNQGKNPPKPEEQKTPNRPEVMY